MARAPTFLVTIDSPVTETTSAGTRVPVVRKRLSAGCSTRSITPERPMAALITSAEPMITTISLEKPSKAFLGGTTPRTIPASRTPSETTS